MYLIRYRTLEVTVNQHSINGLSIYSPKTRADFLSFIVERKGILLALNAEKIINSSPELIEISSDGIAYPDGYGAVLAIEKLAGEKTIKIPGCELWLDIIEKTFHNKKFYFIGGKQEVIDGTVTKLSSQYPGINIVNYRNGYLRSDFEVEELINDIKNLKPDIVFVAMGSPKQEFLMKKLLSQHSALYQGLGGSFDVYVGQVKRAPRIFLDLNLEWLYRLLKQPFRVKRQLKLFTFFFELYRGRITYRRLN